MEQPNIKKLIVLYSGKYEDVVDLAVVEDMETAEKWAPLVRGNSQDVVQMHELFYIESGTEPVMVTNWIGYAAGEGDTITDLSYVPHIGILQLGMEQLGEDTPSFATGKQSWTINAFGDSYEMVVRKMHKALIEAGKVKDDTQPTDQAGE